ncbi:MAG: lactate utilization protein [Desulfobacteraceae bacterium]|nr:lactate utilization protein [Desulfobacteraceae bacterium]
MNNRNRILSCIRTGTVSVKGLRKGPLFRKRSKVDLFHAWEGIEKQKAGQSESLSRSFQKECELLSVKVHVVSAFDEACHFLSSILKETMAKRVIKWDSPLLIRLKIDRLLDSLGVQDMLPADKIPIKEANRKDFVMPESKADLGISGADYGLADSGTLVLRARPDQDRATSLLPPIHVAIIESEYILPGLDDLITRLLLDFEEKGDLNSCLTLITGPSKTADIEMNLVHGVHGPKELHVILLDIPETPS